MPRIAQVSYVRLQLFEEDQAQSDDRFVGDGTDILSLFDRVDVEEHVRLLLEEVRVLLDEGFNELGDEQHGSRVFQFDVLHLLKEGSILFFLVEEVLVGRLKFGFNRFDALVEIVHQVLLVLVDRIGSSPQKRGWILLLLLLQIG